MKILVTGHTGLLGSEIMSLSSDCLEIRPPEDRDWEKQIGRAVSKKNV